MSDSAIEVRGLAKCYRVSGAPMRIGARTLRDAIVERAAVLLGWRSSGAAATATPATARDFWALRDIDLTVNRGEVLGVIGHNGAGKSTLMKILARITDPTAGEATIRGRVGSLLEVGTGFHPELSGRENIFLNGAILGMRRREIAAKLDAIVDFAGVGEFLDTPIKRYSSGMYVRLAFAVAAHLEPEILLVDEVLAVGDAAFQKKCLGKMDDVARSGRTVLFVSHNMAAVQSLCKRAVLLDAGCIVKDGAARDVVHDYFRAVTDKETTPLAARTDRGGDGGTEHVRLTSVRVDDADGLDVIASTSRLRITIGYEAREPLRNARFLAGVYDYTNAGIFLLNTDAQGGAPAVLPARGEVVCETDAINLTPGRCYLNLAIQRGSATIDYVQHACGFDVAADDRYAAGRAPTREWVMCLLDHRWKFNDAAQFADRVIPTRASSPRPTRRKKVLTFPIPQPRPADDDVRDMKEAA